MTWLTSTLVEGRLLRLKLNYTNMTLRVLPQGPSPPQRTAASLDPWSPAGAGGQPGNSGGGDPWGGNIVSQSSIPDPWGRIGAHGVPPRAEYPYNEK